MLACVFGQKHDVGEVALLRNVLQALAELAGATENESFVHEEATMRRE